jgi:vacuolar-type H+-ATPase subunit F/Vma7
VSTTTRTAARLTVIVPPELASGFRLAGAGVDEASDVDDATAALEAMLDEAADGIVGVYAPFHAALPAELAERCDRITAPVVIPLPAGLGAGDPASHRARIAALLERAVGYHIAFSDEDGR